MPGHDESVENLCVNLLLLNAGSSSLKAVLMNAVDGAVLVRGMADWAGSTTRYQFEAIGSGSQSQEVAWKGHAAAVRRFLSDLKSAGDLWQPAAVGHRVVHGGPFTSSVRITKEIRSRIAALAKLAPLHNPPSLEALAAAEVELPLLPHVAVFDTAFHSTLPREAYAYPVPVRWTREWGIRRYGFHGMSHAYCSGRAAELLGRPVEELRLVICHLGHGSSAAAVQQGRSVETTMGFTPLEGLMMATRSGSIDPGIILHLQKSYGMTVEDVETALNRESGLLGVSDLSGDMRQVLAAARGGHELSQLAVEIYSRRVRQAIGALAVTMGGVDVLVFTAGVGEHASEVRAKVCAGLDCLGLVLDASRNASCHPDSDIAASFSPGRILVIATREEVTMFHEVLQVLAASSKGEADQ